MQRFRIGADIDDLWQAVQQDPVSEKQAQWLMLQFCPVNFEVTEWIECSRLNLPLLTNLLATTDLRISPMPHGGRNGKEEIINGDDDGDNGNITWGLQTKFNKKGVHSDILAVLDAIPLQNILCSST